MNLQAGLPVRNRRADFQHVRAQHLHPRRIQVIGVILHEGRAAVQSGAHDLHGAQQRGGLPVAFRAKAVAIRHQPLRGQSRQLCQSVQILERRGEALEIALFEEAPHPDFDPRGFPDQGVPFALRPHLRR